MWSEVKYDKRFHSFQNFSSKFRCIWNSILLKISDKYFSWGNKSKDKIIYPMFVSTTVGKKIKKKNPRGILISIKEVELVYYYNINRRLEKVLFRAYHKLDLIVWRYFYVVIV